MARAALRFLGYEASTSAPNVVVDGSPNAGTVLVLSHWPGMPTPASVEADTSCEMVFRHLDGGADLHGDAAVVTNNHPSWLDDPARCRDLWAEEDAELDAAEAAVAGGQVEIAEHREVDLAVVTLPASGRSAGHRFAGRRFGGIHPMPLHAATDRSVLLVIDPTDGRHHLTCRYEGWVQFRSRPIRPRVDLAPLAERLTADEPGGARWWSTPPSDLTPELATDADGPGSSLDPGRLAIEVIRFLAEAPPAWDPYRIEG